MKIGKGNTVYFIGIGGIGMSAIARFFLHQGAEVYGYDRTKTDLTRQLEKEGMHIHYHEDDRLIPLHTDLVVFTPAIPETNSELRTVKKIGLKLMKRSEVLGELTRDLFTIAIAGTHGKTTITSLTAFIFHLAGLPVSAFIGGISNNFGSNLLLSEQAEYVVVEADEFDKSFLKLHPSIAVISSMDADHLDIYGDHQQLMDHYQQFASRIRAGGTLVFRHGLPLLTDHHFLRYGIGSEPEVKAQNIRVEDGYFVFDLTLENEIFPSVRCQQPGRHNIENALAAVSVARSAGVPVSIIVRGIEEFKGVQRRFDIRFRSSQTIFVDDYAHHPEELRACISGARELYAGKKLTGVFQPHLFTRTRDLMEGFAESLALLDEVILLPIYPAREEPIPEIDSAILLDRIPMQNKRLVQKEELLSTLSHLRPEVLLSLGAGDIDQFVEPIVKLCSTW